MVALYFLLAAAALAPEASAGLASEEQVQRVEYGDLDLNSPGGKATLQRRLDRAAQKACDDRPGPKTQGELRIIIDCKQSARAEARHHYQQAIGAALAAGKSERPRL